MRRIFVACFVALLLFVVGCGSTPASSVPKISASAPVVDASQNASESAPDYDPLDLRELLGSTVKASNLTFDAPSAKDFAGTALSAQEAKIPGTNAFGVSATGYASAFGGVIYRTDYIADDVPDSDRLLLAQAYLRAVQYYQSITQLPVKFIENGKAVTALPTSAESLVEFLQRDGYCKATFGSGDIDILVLSPLDEIDGNFFRVGFAAPTYDVLQLYSGMRERPQTREALDLSMWTQGTGKNGGNKYSSTGSVVADSSNLVVFASVQDDAYGTVREASYIFQSFKGDDEQTVDAFRAIFEEIVLDIGRPAAVDVDGITFVTEYNFDELLDQALDALLYGDNSTLFIWDSVRGISLAVSLDNEDSFPRMIVFFDES